MKEVETTESENGGIVKENHFHPEPVRAFGAVGLMVGLLDLGSLFQL